MIKKMTQKFLVHDMNEPYFRNSQEYKKSDPKSFSDSIKVSSLKKSSNISGELKQFSHNSMQLPNKNYSRDKEESIHQLYIQNRDDADA